MIEPIHGAVPNADAIIRTELLDMERDGSTVLRAINIDIPEGAVVGLVGRNGAGKTSLLQCLAGLRLPTRGRAWVLGCPVQAQGDVVRDRLGYVAQTPDLFDWMTVEQMLRAIGCAYTRWTWERAQALSAQLDLRLSARISSLSGGDQQKMAVVLALAHDPDVLLLDEPVTSLDPVTRREFMRALFARTEGGDDGVQTDRPRTVVISSHSLHDLERVVTHVAFIREGRLQLFDAWDALSESLRRVNDVAPVPSHALVARNSGTRQCVVDVRQAPAFATQGEAVTLDELFVELNA
jgi:ABC-2 type transport system ATP-binding protein